MIVSSFADQYGIRLYSALKTMKWEEFCALLIGISPDTALGRIVSIRSEEDTEVLKSFTPEMRKIRSEWRNRIAKNKDQAQCDDFVEAMRKAFMDMAGFGGAE